MIGASKIARDISDRKRADAERARLLALAQQQVATTREAEPGRWDWSRPHWTVADRAGGHRRRDRTDRRRVRRLFLQRDRPARPASRTCSTRSRAHRRKRSTNFPHPRATAIFGPTFRGEGVVRLDDVTQGPALRTERAVLRHAAGHLPVRSYLAVPVRSRTGDVLGGLFFGHSAPGRFTEQHEELAAGIAAWASVALENARLYGESQEASRMKDEFLATLSHELRTPLNAILGYARMLRSGHRQRRQARRARSRRIERNATSLTQIVEDVLDVSRIISGKIRLDVQPVDMPALIVGTHSMRSRRRRMQRGSASRPSSTAAQHPDLRRPRPACSR